MNLFSILGLDNNFSLNIQYPLNIYHLSVSHNYMKSTYSILIISVILISLSPITVLSDFVTEDGIKIQLFKQKSKKPIPLKSYSNNSTDESGFQEYEIEVNEPIDKIFLNGYYNDYHEDLSYRLTIFNLETDKIVLFKDTLTFTMSKSFNYSLGGKEYKGKEEGTTYTLPVSPWITKSGKYHILIERNNFDETSVLSIKYTIK